MPNTTTSVTEPPARTHAQAQALLRRPFAPGAIGFRAMHRVALGDRPSGGAQIAAYIAAQSVIQRLNTVVPGRWRQEFQAVTTPPDSRKLYLLCRLTVTLPVTEGGGDVEAVYEDLGEVDAGQRGGLKALYSDARKRSGAVAGIGTYLYTSLRPIVLPIGDGENHVQAVTGFDRPDTLVLPAGTEQWLRGQYAREIVGAAIVRDLGEVLSHGEPEHGMGQGEATELPGDRPSAEDPHDEQQSEPAATQTAASAGNGNGVVSIDFGALGPAAPDQEARG